MNLAMLGVTRMNCVKMSTSKSCFAQRASNSVVSIHSSLYSERSGNRLLDESGCPLEMGDDVIKICYLHQTLGT
jgi:hypothetical protein